MALASENWGFPPPFVCTHPSEVWEPLSVWLDGYEPYGYRCGRCKVYINKRAADARREEEANGVLDARRLQDLPALS